MLSQLTAAEDRRQASDQEKKELEALRKTFVIDDNERSWDRQDELWNRTHSRNGEVAPGKAVSRSMDRLKGNRCGQPHTKRATRLRQELLEQYCDPTSSR